MPPTYQIIRNFSSPDFSTRVKDPDGSLRGLNDHHVSLDAAKSAIRGRSKSKLTWTHFPAKPGYGELWEGRTGETIR